VTRALRHEWHTALYDPERSKLRDKRRGVGMVGKLVGGALIEYANGDGVAWPSLAELAERVGVRSERTVQKGVTELEDAGLLRVERNAGHVNRYRLTLPDPSTRWTSSDDRPPHEAAGVLPHEPPHEPPHERPHELASGTIEPGEPVEPSSSGALTRTKSDEGENHTRPNPRALVTWIVNHGRELDVELPQKYLGHIGRELAALVDEGKHDELTLRRALAALVAGGWHPTMLPTLVVQVQRGTDGPRNTHAEHPIDRRIREGGIDLSQVVRGVNSDRPPAGRDKEDT